MKPDELLSRLERLLPAQFERVLFHLRIPLAQLAGVSAPQSIRAIELLRHLENTGELARLEPLLLPYDSAAGLAEAKPVPIYPDAEVEAEQALQAGLLPVGSAARRAPPGRSSRECVVA
jgi:hypothetical protein